MQVAGAANGAADISFDGEVMLDEIVLDVELVRFCRIVVLCVLVIVSIHTAIITGARGWRRLPYTR